MLPMASIYPHSRMLWDFFGPPCDKCENQIQGFIGRAFKSYGLSNPPLRLNILQLT